MVRHRYIEDRIAALEVLTKGTLELVRNILDREKNDIDQKKAELAQLKLRRLQAVLAKRTPAKKSRKSR